jgi:2-polyprenyl-3-methyl-5-hydroxy-6-metoxy-1,4-benzoquinol methylase
VRKTRSHSSSELDGQSRTAWGARGECEGHGRVPHRVSAIMIVGGELGYRLLCLLAPPASLIAQHGNPSATCPPPVSLLPVYFGPELWSVTAGATVIDFGCGFGGDAIELARRGARRVVGIEIRDWVIDCARKNAAAAGVAGKCSFAKATDEKADVIVSVDTFEHIQDLGAAMQQMRHMLAPGGSVWASFGPPWFHPRGGHIFSVLPWAHVMFTEKALMRWRSSFTPGTSSARRFMDWGLSMLTIREFLRTVDESPLKAEWVDLVPIRPLRFLHTRPTRAWTTSVVRCRLVPR